jgi:hydroxymethylbilane synthase
VSQGVIGVGARAGVEAPLAWLRALDDARARLATSAERALLRRLEGGCQVPLGALAELLDGTLTLEAAVCALDGSRELRARGTAAATPSGPLTPADAVALGERIANQLLAAGAAELIARERSALAVTAP